VTLAAKSWLTSWCEIFQIEMTMLPNNKGCVAAERSGASKYNIG
jgi:hypothetical protein